MPKSVLILVVDDIPDQLYILSEILRRAGYEVASSRSAEAALARARTLKPDLILTDLAMPVVNGVTLIDHVRSDPALKDTPIVAVTAHVWGAIAQAAKKVGANAFISKPFNQSELLAEVEKQLVRAQKSQ